MTSTSGGRRHPIRGGVFGLLLGLVLGLDLLLFGIIRSDSVVLTILPLVGLVGGLALGITTPLGRRPRADDVDEVGAGDLGIPG